MHSLGWALSAPLKTSPTVSSRRTCRRITERKGLLGHPASAVGEADSLHAFLGLAAAALAGLLIELARLEFAIDALVVAESLQATHSFLDGLVVFYLNSNGQRVASSMLQGG